MDLQAIFGTIAIGFLGGVIFVIFLASNSWYLHAKRTCYPYQVEQSYIGDWSFKCADATAR